MTQALGGAAHSLAGAIALTVLLLRTTVRGIGHAPPGAAPFIAGSSR